MDRKDPLERFVQNKQLHWGIADLDHEQSDIDVDGNLLLPDNFADLDHEQSGIYDIDVDGNLLLPDNFAALDLSNALPTQDVCLSYGFWYPVK
jgi:hypothetical protein